MNFPALSGVVAPCWSHRLCGGGSGLHHFLNCVRRQRDERTEQLRLIGERARPDGFLRHLSLLVRAGGLEPPRPVQGLRIFVPLRLSPPRQRRVRGLDYPFTMPPIEAQVLPV